MINIFVVLSKNKLSHEFFFITPFALKAAIFQIIES